MYVLGSSSQQSCPFVTRPTRPWNLDSVRSRTRCASTRFSTHQKPALWRVASYSRPGLPRPTTSLMRCSGRAQMNRRAHARPGGPVRGGSRVFADMQVEGRLLLTPVPTPVLLLSALRFVGLLFA